MLRSNAVDEVEAAVGGVAGEVDTNDPKIPPKPDAKELLAGEDVSEKGTEELPTATEAGVDAAACLGATGVVDDDGVLLKL